MRTRRLARILLVASAWLVLSASVSGQSDGDQQAWVGDWEAGEGKKRQVLRLEADRCVWTARGGELRAFLARTQGQGLELNVHGTVLPLQFELVGEELAVTIPGERKPRRYRRAAEPLPEFEHTPFELGADPPDRRDVRRANNELAKRVAKDRAVRTGTVNEKKMQKIDAENTAYLAGLVGRFGWVDVERFGIESARAAWELVVHSTDLSLMRAALPAIKADVDAKRLPNGEDYANLLDRVLMFDGRRQRYGTQIVQDAKGRTLVFPLEDAETVDQRRAELGMQTLAESLEMHQRWNGGQKIEIQRF